MHFLEIIQRRIWNPAELCAKIVKIWKPLTISAKRLILDVWQGFEYADNDDDDDDDDDDDTFFRRS